jgi:hypothetical protein
VDKLNDTLKFKFTFKPNTIQLWGEDKKVVKEIKAKKLVLSFEDYLDLLFEMTPVTVQQFHSMMDQINEVLQQNGATWPGYA